MNIKNHIIIIVLLGIPLSIIIILSIIPSSKSSDVRFAGNLSFQYALDKPDEIYTIPEYLTELSGLCLYKEDKLFCIQDERADVYKYNLSKKKITDDYKYKKKGDFEGIAFSGNLIWLLESNGTIYEVSDFKKKDYKIDKLETPLSAANNCEGLCYDPQINSLLIACKGDASLPGNDHRSEIKAIYRYDLKRRKLIKKPYLEIDLDQLHNLEEMSRSDRLSYKLASAFDESGDIRFQPSGLAVHPKSNDIYVIASVGSKLIVLDRNSKIRTIQDLSKKIHKQPEGICFDPEGNLYIANEGQGGKAKIYKYSAE